MANGDSIPKEIAEFNGTKGFCNICNKELTSKIVFDQHIAGKSHKKAYERWENGLLSSGDLNKVISNDTKICQSGNTLDNSKKCYNFEHSKKTGTCFACNVEFTNFINLQSHLKENDHIKKEEEWSLSNETPAITKAVTGYSKYTDSVSDDSSALVRLGQGINPADNTKWYYCKYCKKQTNTIEQLRMHEASPRHKREVERYTAGLSQNAAEKTLWLYCEICNKKVNSEEQLKIHMKSHSSKGRLTALEDFDLHRKPNISGNDPLPFQERKKEQSPFNSEAEDKSNSGSNWAKGWGSSTQAEEESVVCNLTDKLNKCMISDDFQQRSDNYSATESLKEEWFPFECKTCNMKFTGEKPYQQHMKGKTHVRSLQQQNSDKGDSSVLSPYKFRCDTCNVYFYTDRDREAHYEGKKHKEKAVKANVAPEMPQIKIYKNVHTYEDNLVEYSPWDHQVTLYKQAMENDAVCFLPTGTGKTLVAVMVLSHMLNLNPHHSAVFLVDKILLGYQQHQVIKKQIGNKVFRRYDANKRTYVQRTLNIALVCSGKQDTVQDMPLWEHDVIVATAAYYENLLDKKVLRWEHNCLVILDESHHCIKDHPYCRLMFSYHHQLPEEAERPKILGLTASPAGKATLAKTKSMMIQLLENLGSVRLITTEMKELNAYCSATELKIKNVNLTKSENALENVLQQHLLACYQKLKEQTNIDEFIDSHSDGITDLAENLQDVICLALPKGNVDSIKMTALKEHTVVILDAVLSIRELSMQYAYTQLMKLEDEMFVGNFNNLESLNVNCNPIKELMASYNRMRRIDAAGLEKDDELPIVKQLLNDIITEVDWSGEQSPRPLVLVLIRQRKHAMTLNGILAKSAELKQRNIATTCIVGHGDGHNNGMSVKKQQKTFHEIQNRKYQLMVATSVAEEGIDIPECEMVVQIDPPTNVKSLVQIRGRARKRNGKFIALCRDQKQVDALSSLLKQERNMIQAAKEILAEQCHGRLKFDFNLIKTEKQFMYE